MAGESTINVPLMRKVLEHITAHPEEHNQHVWAERNPCGTTYCMAGQTVLMAGHEIAWSNGSEPDLDEDCADHVTTRIETPDGRSNYIPHVAARELGLSGCQATELFYDSTSIEDLWENANHYTDGEIEIPEQFKETI